MRSANYKPFLFTTTLRSPERIKYFLKVLKEFEGQILTNQLAIEILAHCIKEKIYKPQNSYNSHKELLEKYKSNEALTIDDAWLLIKSSDQNHKQYGFDDGWSSRFKTCFEITMKFGLSFFTPPNIKQSKIIISELGNKLIEGVTFKNIPNQWQDDEPNDKEQAIFSHCLAKYQRKNPFTAELNINYPLSLLLRTIKRLNNDPDLKTKAGISRQELPIYLIWKDNDDEALFKTIKDLRLKYGLKPSTEVILDICDSITGVRYNSYQDKSLSSDLPDDNIRKLRITGLFTYRGGGRFLDINKNKHDVCEYIIQNYSSVKNYTHNNIDDQIKYFEEVSSTDNKLLNYQNENIVNISHDQLDTWLNTYNWEKIKSELDLLEKKRNSSDEILRFIPGPARFEFLTALALRLKMSSYKIKPNYPADDQGLPTSTAPGGAGDIECTKTNETAIIEVTLLNDSNQAANEMPRIKRHIQSKIDETSANFNFAVFIAPRIHPDSKSWVDFLKSEQGGSFIVNPYNIKDFINYIENNNSLASIN